MLFPWLEDEGLLLVFSFLPSLYLFSFPTCGGFPSRLAGADSRYGRSRHFHLSRDLGDAEAGIVEGEYFFDFSIGVDRSMVILTKADAVGPYRDHFGLT